MLFDYKFHGSTSVESNAHATQMSFAPDVSREPTYFIGTLAKNIAFREAISALNGVVVSDLRFKPKDKTEYKAWAAQQELAWLAQFTAHQPEVEAKINTIKEELSTIGKTRETVLGPYYKARRKYFDYLYEKEKDFWFVLDPVITVHPDEVFFECFSQDESTYGKLGCNYEVFKNIQEFACGTTNIDYSAALYNEFQKIRDYKETQFTVEPAGFKVQTAKEDDYTEVKIDLPDSWVRGFLQVSSAMTLPARTFDLHPMDVHNICYVLRRQKEKTGPRSIRFILRPGQPVVLQVDPWNYRITCHRSIYQGTEADEIRLWGRRRLLILERLIPLTQKFTVHVLGSGMPSFFIADLGHMNFTLGLSGWTANDWSRAGNFDLMAPRAQVDNFTKELVFKSLRETWQESSQSLAKRLNLEKKLVEGALAAYTQAGRVIYDLDKKIYRLRELSRDPLPMDKLRFDNPREATATELVNNKRVTVKVEILSDGTTELTGTVKEQNQLLRPSLVIDADERMTQATCTCYFYSQNKLFKGPCEHILALRIAHTKEHWWAKWMPN
ncbi:SWIM zinc finger family protein [Rhodocytophaga aerolata]|uniref:SWIM zinc finger family protein n=1 Tax=Rhodocytophaga aerolata TaxID=455078 RepID=A0ABT8R079_9BACT|nr:SWIM zinc finger family protein [Rhodocytophaga aerolata]MDO1445505.1 SWIM zinc finger family protein [Rhodocytophaga aerolata]